MRKSAQCRIRPYPPVITPTYPAVAHPKNCLEFFEVGPAPLLTEYQVQRKETVWFFKPVLVSFWNQANFLVNVPATSRVEDFMIPEEKSAAVARALQDTFGVTEFTDVRWMTKGLSSDLVFRIVVRGTPYLLRIMTRIDERMDPNRIFACMNAAANAGLTPRVRYSNAENGISIT